MGVQKPRDAVAGARANRNGGRHRRRREKTVARQDGNFVRRAGLLQRSSEAVHEWLGAEIYYGESLGEVLPCPTAHEIKSLRFDNVREKSLAWIWNESEAFNRFRRDGMAAAAVPGLRISRGRLRWLPLPGGADYRRRSGHGSGLPVFTASKIADGICGADQRQDGEISLDVDKLIRQNGEIQGEEETKKPRIDIRGSLKTICKQRPMAADYSCSDSAYNVSGISRAFHIRRNGFKIGCHPKLIVRSA